MIKVTNTFRLVNGCYWKLGFPTRARRQYAMPLRGISSMRKFTANARRKWN